MVILIEKSLKIQQIGILGVALTLKLCKDAWMKYLDVIHH